MANNERNLGPQGRKGKSKARTEKFEHFTIISNEIYRNPKISARAKGVHSFAMTCADEWEFSLRGLAEMFKEGRGAIAKALQELEAWGYLTRTQIRDNGLILETEWIFHAERRKRTNFLENSPRSKKPDLENPDAVNQPKEITKRRNTQIEEGRPPASSSGGRSRKGLWTQKDYSKHRLTAYRTAEDYHNAENSALDCIELAMNVVQEVKPASWVGTIQKAVEAGKTASECKRVLGSLTFILFHEMNAGERPANPAAVLMSRFKKELGI